MTQGLDIEEVIKGEKIPLQWLSAGGDLSLSYEYKVAERYAKYFARRTAGAAPACVLKFSVRKEMLSEMKVVDWTQLEAVLERLGEEEMARRCVEKV